MRRLLWVDCTGALLVGTLVLWTSSWLSRWYGLPLDVLRFTGAANLAFGCYSFFLASRPERPTWMIALLVAANLTWPAVCAALLLRYGASATPLGMVHLAGEGVYVAALGILEWRHRGLLRRP